MCIHRLILRRCYSTRISSKLFITTPIYYVNATPHIGHLYSSVIADCYQRFYKLCYPNNDIIFTTGTDEHGAKIQKAAESNKTSVEIYCNNISSKYQELCNAFNIDKSHFIRTSDEKHKDTVEQFWKIINNNGHIYKTNYKGWYCLSDETFLTESQLTEVVRDDQKVLVSQESGHPVEWTEEENFMFKLSNFKDDLKYWLKQNDGVVKPHKFHKILFDSLSDDIPDISVSRPASRVHWGIPVPGDNTQTIYVWMDALVNYLTAIGYPDNEGMNNWPVDVHVVGKDILKFHGIYWPAFLMAANLEPPKSIFCHSHWTVNAEKMSKSKENVVCPMQRSEIYSRDGLRYFLLREGVSHSDGNYSDTKILRILNSELADTLGNLLSRCTGQALNPEQIFTRFIKVEFDKISNLEVTKNFVESTEKLPDICLEHYKDFNFYKVADAVMATLRLGNLFFETMKPWELKKNPLKMSELEAVIHIVQESLRISGIILQPMLPELSKQLLDKLQVPQQERKWKNLYERSWNHLQTEARKLNSDNLVLFKRIIPEKATKPIKQQKKIKTAKT